MGNRSWKTKGAPRQNVRYTELPSASHGSVHNEELVYEGERRLDKADKGTEQGRQKVHSASATKRRERLPEVHLPSDIFIVLDNMMLRIVIMS